MANTGVSNTISIDLGEHFAGFIQHQIEIGHFKSEQDAIKAALRLLEQELESDLPHSHKAQSGETSERENDMALLLEQLRAEDS